MQHLIKLSLLIEN